MAKKYHISADGTPGECKASSAESCPKTQAGDGFHGNLEEATRESERRLESEFGGTATARAERPERKLRYPRSIPKAVDLSQIPDSQWKADPKDIVPVGLPAGTKLSVSLMKPQGDMSSYGHNFTLGSVAEYSRRYHDNVEEKVERAKSLGHPLYYATAEGVMITAHKQAPEARRTIEIGTIIEMDEQKFQVLQSPNNNLELVPFEVD